MGWKDFFRNKPATIQLASSDNEAPRDTAQDEPPCCVRIGSGRAHADRPVGLAVLLAIRIRASRAALRGPEAD